ncbi:MAG: chromate efflux transporter, partial [Desulfomonilaceae bacterium]
MNGCLTQKFKHTPSLSHMFISFLKLGLTAFGGLANMAYIRRMVVEDKQWLDDETFLDGTALCQIVPGSTTMQLAAYVGLRIGGITGAIVCLVGFGLPAFLLMMCLSTLYSKTQALPTAVSVFNGLQTIVVAIIANATFLFAETSLRNWSGLIIVGFAAITFGMGTTPVAVILLTGALGIVIFGDRQNEPQKGVSIVQNIAPKRIVLLLSIVAFGLTLLYLCNQKLFDLATTMAKIDLFAFGGGPASVPLMYHEVVEIRSWLDSSTLMNGIALGQLTPGPVIITATFVGYLLYGPIGG